MNAVVGMIRMQDNEEMRNRKACRRSYLAFDVYFRESCGTKAFEPAGTLFHFHTELGLVLDNLLFNKVLGSMFGEELTAFAVILEAKLIGEEAERNGHISIRCQPRLVKIGVQIHTLWRC